MENRYDKYKDSGIAWIGEIPEHWKVCKLSTLFFQHKQKNNDTQESNLLSLSYGNIKRKDINTSEGLLPESFENYNIIDKDDIVFRLTDLQNDKRSLRSALCKERGIITSAYIVIRKRSNLNSSYFNHLFRAYDECKVFYGLGEGVRQGMNYDDLRNLEILLPEQTIQQSIAAYLDQKCGEIDELITLQEEMITKLQSYKQSVITEAVTKGLDKNVPLKDSGIEWIGEIPEHWSIICLKRLCRISTGNQDTQDSIPDGKYPFFVRSPKVERSNNYTFEGPSILMAGDGVGAGKVFHLADNKFACHQRVYCINQFSVIVNRIYLFYYMSSLFYNIIDSANSKSTVDSVRLPMLAEFPVCIPLKYEQQAIADYLNQKCSEIDELISIKQQKIEKLKEYRKSLIFECVTGKRKVS